MKFLQLKFLTVLAFALCAACASEQAGQTSNSNQDTARTLINSNSPVTSPVVDPAETPANRARRAPDVPYVPTHEMVVDEMLKMAEVKGTDVLYDLGSGDGRIPITAAQRFGTRGVGVDINPERIKEANENARKAGVTDKVRFIEGDIFDTDFSEATVVTLYLLPDINMKLRPKLFEQLKPGTRVVSHNYDMGDWIPEKTKTVKTPAGSEHYVYFWRVPERKP